MTPPRYVVTGVGCLVMAGVVQAAPMVSHFPDKDLALFVMQTFDLASIRSSFGPRRTPEERTFADFGMKPSKATERVVEFDVPGQWYYALSIAGRRDVNGDGIEDVEVCFTDAAQNGGTYRTMQALVVTRYAHDAYAVALSFSANETVCGGDKP